MTSPNSVFATHFVRPDACARDVGEQVPLDTVQAGGIGVEGPMPFRVGGEVHEIVVREVSVGGVRRIVAEMKFHYRVAAPKEAVLHRRVSALVHVDGPVGLAVEGAIGDGHVIRLVNGDAPIALAESEPLHGDARGVGYEHLSVLAGDPPVGHGVQVENGSTVDGVGDVDVIVPARGRGEKP